jgi:hypothetical protein
LIILKNLISAQNFGIPLKIKMNKYIMNAKGGLIIYAEGGYHDFEGGHDF